MNLKLLVVEGNLIEENQNFKKAGIETHTESLADSLSFFNKHIDLDVVNPSSDKNIMNKVKDLNKYNGLVIGCNFEGRPAKNQAVGGLEQAKWGENRKTH